MRTRPAAAFACAVIALNACREATGPRPVMLQQIRGDSQAGLPGDTLPVPLTVKVTSESGAPLGGVPVTWTATAGSRLADSGSVSGPDGTAETRVILGLLPGPVVVTASAAGAGEPASSRFHAVIKDPCGMATALALGEAASGSFTAKDCRFFDGSRLDVWTLTLDAPQRVDIVMNSAAVNAYLVLEDTVQSLAYDNDAGPGTDAVIRALLPARRFFVIANTLRDGELGDYTLLTAAAPGQIASAVFAVPPGARGKVFVQFSAADGGNAGASYTMAVR
jgi:hypothetical protein